MRAGEEMRRAHTPARLFVRGRIALKEFGASHVNIPLNRKGSGFFGSSQPRRYRLRRRHLDHGELRPVTYEVTVSVNAAIAAIVLVETV